MTSTEGGHIDRNCSLAWGVAAIATIALLLMLVYVNRVPVRGELGTDVHFHLLETDKNWPSSVHVYGGMSERSSDDTLWLFVAVEPMLFRGSFNVKTTAGSATLDLGTIEHEYSGEIYRVDIKGLRRLFIDSERTSFKFARQVKVFGFDGFLK